MVTRLRGLAEIRIVAGVIEAYRDEQQCRRPLEGMIWPGEQSALKCDAIKTAELQLSQMPRSLVYKGAV